MALDLALLARVVDELAAVLPGARVDKVIHDVHDGLVLALHRLRKDYYLLFAPERSLPRIHLVSRKPTGTASPAGFILYLRKHLTGTRVEEVRLAGGDRVVEMRFVGPGGAYRLIFELTGSVTNIVLTDEGLRILSVHRAVPPGDKVIRPLVPGIAYCPPELRQGKETGKPTDIPLLDREEYSGNAPVNAAVEVWYERSRSENEAASLRRRLAAVIRKAEVRAARRRDAVAGDVAKAEQGDECRVAGELILANKHLLRKGQPQARLPGFAGGTVTIALDPSRSPAENAARYFQRYRKARSGLALMRERLAAAGAEAVLLKGLHDDLDGAADRAGLLAVLAELAHRGYVRDDAGRLPAAVRSAAPPFRTIEHEGWQILVGKSSAGNDYITMRLARPDDLWLHAEGMPGSHVVVRNPGKGDIPDSVLRKAAALAAYYSRGRGSTKVPVAYTKASMVKKPKGAAPGTVVLAVRKTVMAAPESA